MVTLHLQQGNIEMRGIPQTISFRKLLIDCIDYVPNGGISNADQRLRNKIAAKLEAIKDEDTMIELEDAEFDELANLHDKMRWAVRSKVLTDLDDEIQRAREERKKPKT